MAEAQVFSLAERLKQRRAELGLSQAQAARELDVARTAYRLWEMEAARPQPDRWRLISRWLGVSITALLLAEDELDDGLGESGDRVGDDFSRVGRDWDLPLTDPAEFFSRANALVKEGTEKGFMTAEHAEELHSLFDRIRVERIGVESEAWQPVRLERQLKSNVQAPKAARDALRFVAGDVESDILGDAQLLISELVTNSVVHGPADGTIGMVIDVARGVLRVEVTDAAEEPPTLGEADETEGYGLQLVDRLAARWDTSRPGAGNLTWFELDLRTPGAQPERP